LRPTGKELQREPPEVKDYLKSWKDFEIRKDILYRNALVDGSHLRQLVLPV
jgi:hypothetical protein